MGDSQQDLVAREPVAVRSAFDNGAGGGAFEDGEGDGGGSGEDIVTG